MMFDAKNWNWEAGQRVISDMNQWQSKFNWIEEPYISQDGEKIAAIVNDSEGEFNVCVNDETWEQSFEKIWYLRFSPDCRLTALVSEDEEWTVAVDGIPWENRYDYVWNTMFDENGKNIAVTFQQDMEYGMALNDNCWRNTYGNITKMALSPCGSKTAAVVQNISLKEGDIFTFQDGVYTVAEDGTPWDINFVNVWNVVFSPDAETIAAEIRLNLYDYTIAVNGTPWNKIFDCVWEPAFHPLNKSIVAPVMTNGKWGMAQDGDLIWDQRFVQIWQQMFSPDGSKLAAIVAAKYGKWTIAVDGRPWSISFNDLLTDPVFSPEGDKILLRAVENGKYIRYVIQTDELLS